MPSTHWIDLARDLDTGIETLHAHFQGHAYDPHWHDSYLVGVTRQGVQQFNCRRQRHASTPGQVFTLEPGEIHDGNAPCAEGFTYQMLYLDPHWLSRELSGLFEQAPDRHLPSFANTLQTESRLAHAVMFAFTALHQKELRIVRQSAVDELLAQLIDRVQWRRMTDPDPRLPQVALRARDYLHAHLHQDVGMNELAAVCGVDRFRLTRAFKAAFGLPPHAYLVQLRLAKARRMLAAGIWPAQVSSDLGFADQSHLGRWFMRAYGLSPAAYRLRCSNLPD
ncbi:AraC family transcriptional regulator [Pseudomonas syringae]|uniref:AraC family transcriptional regulator n=1 Tax=Pseudomonas syringae TaxID=317 RepID=UPI000464BCFE|nr:AraC family transcriptional regulator [Pseudomonas syringae]MBI6817451.1 AraC family transcriptional regulator [Pseudomonas syringae]MBI6824492.1 AraC family transcriptional regulator [Pseudomonas syringae]OBS35388.1 AraC family transcriptional regulator [Pseudomonas syringae pv. syringae]